MVNTYCFSVLFVKLKSGPNQIPLFKVPFWIEVHNLPVGFISMVVGQSIANFLGEYLDYDEKNASNPWRSYMKIQVLLVDVR